MLPSNVCQDVDASLSSPTIDLTPLAANPMPLLIKLPTTTPPVIDLNMLLDDLLAP